MQLSTETRYKIIRIFIVFMCASVLYYNTYTFIYILMYSLMAFLSTSYYGERQVVFVMILLRNDFARIELSDCLFCLWAPGVLSY